jgi:trk system potassium uptake protein
MKQFAVIGLGRFGSAVAQTLAALGHEVMGVDRDPVPVEEHQEILTHVLQADCTEEETVRSLGLRNFDAVVVAIGHDIQASILITVLLKELGVRNVVAKAAGDLHGKVLSKVGADRVIYPEREMGSRIAHNLIADSVVDYIELSPEIRIVELQATEEMIGKTLRQLEFRARYGITVMAIKTGERINATPMSEDVIREGDILVVIGENTGLLQMEKRQGEANHAK